MIISGKAVLAKWRAEIKEQNVKTEKFRKEGEKQWYNFQKVCERLVFPGQEDL